MEQPANFGDRNPHTFYGSYQNKYMDRVTYFFTGVEPVLVKDLGYESRAHRTIGLYILSIVVAMFTGMILFRYSFGFPAASFLLVMLILILYIILLRGYFLFINGRYYNGWVSALLAIPLLLVTWLLFNPFILFFLKDDVTDGNKSYINEQRIKIQSVFERDSVALYSPLDSNFRNEKAIQAISFRISTLEPEKISLEDAIRRMDSVLQQVYANNAKASEINASAGNIEKELNKNLAAQDDLYIAASRVEDSIAFYKKNIQSYDNRITAQIKRRSKPDTDSPAVQDALSYLEDRRDFLTASLATLTKQEKELREKLRAVQLSLKNYPVKSRNIPAMITKLNQLNERNRETGSTLLVLRDTLGQLTGFEKLVPKLDTLRQLRDSLTKKAGAKRFNIGRSYNVVNHLVANDPDFKRKYLLLTLLFAAPFLILLLYANLRKNIYRMIYTDYTQIQEQSSRKQGKNMIDIEKIKYKNIELDNTLNELRARNLSKINVDDMSQSMEPEDYYFSTALKLEEIIKQTRFTSEFSNAYVEEALYNINSAIALVPNRSAFWELKSRLHFLGENTAEGKIAADEFQRLRSEELFQTNLGRNIVIDEMVFEGLKFYGSFSWKLNASMNILLGRNGYGKSHLLSIVAALLQNDSTKSFELSLINKPGAKGALPGRHIKIYLDSDHELDKKNLEQKRAEIDELKSKIKTITAANNLPAEDTSVENMRSALRQNTEAFNFEKGMIILNATSLNSRFGKIPLLAIPDLRFVNKATENTDNSVNDRLKGDEFLKNTAYHFIHQLPYEAVLQNLLNILATSYFDNYRSFNAYFFTLISTAFEELTGSTFQWHEIHSNHDGSYRITVLTEGNEDPIPVQKISQGTFSVLSVFGLIYIFLKKKYPGITADEAIMQQQAIVIIDELDAHLHPAWQQKIIGLLRRTFPGCQFIITAHSPLIVAGCKDEEVSVMREIKGNEQVDHGFYVEQIKEDFIGYTSDELYKRIFEIEGKDELYLQYAAMQPFEKQMQEEKAQLEERKMASGELPPEDEKRLEKLYEDLYYLGKAKTKIEEKNTLSALRSENIRLKADIETLLMKTRPQAP